MKKVVRMMGLCALVALAFTSCKKNETNGNLTLTASMPQIVSNDRTVISDNALCWYGGDTIKVLSQGEVEKFGIIETGKRTTAFNITGKEDFLSNLKNNGTYFAFYPNADCSANQATINLSNNQTRIGIETGASINTYTYPMFAYNTGSNFQFHSNAGILRIRLRKSRNTTDVVKVGSIDLIAVDNNDQLVGNMTYTTNYVLNPATRLNVENPSNQVTLTCEVPEELLSGDQSNPEYSFDFVLFEGALSGEFLVKVRNENGQLIGDFKAGASHGGPDDYNHTILKEEIIIMPAREILGTIIPE